MAEAKSIITSYAREVGFDLVKVASAQEFSEDRKITLDRIRDGLMDGLPWFNQSRVLRGANPQELLPGARSIICLGLNYFESSQDYGQDSPESETPFGKVARYAWGRDYHKIIKKRMRDYVAGERLGRERLGRERLGRERLGRERLGRERLGRERLGRERLGRENLAEDFKARWYVDDGPMLDRAAAHRAGLGWFGKNTNILTPSLGSWVFLGQIITDLDLEPDQPLKKTCGNCVRCIDACPTGAITAPYVVDNAKCISYLTIENRGDIPLALRPQIGDWIFGCDICQDVCPVNQKTSPAPTLWQRKEYEEDSPQHESPIGEVSAGDVSAAADRERTAGSTDKQERKRFPPGQAPPAAHSKIEVLDLVELLGMTEDDFRLRFRGSPILRAKRVGIQRNACVALGNKGDPVAVPALRLALSSDESLVRGHAAWALGNIGITGAREALQQAQTDEEDDSVLQEIDQALDCFKHLDSAATNPAC